MEGDRLGNLVADPMHGIERGHRLLKDHRDLIAAHGAHAIEIERQEVASLTVSTSEEHAAGECDQGRRWREAHDGKAGDALAGTRFADQRQSFAGAQRKRNVAHGLERTAFGGKGHREVFHFKHDVAR